MSRKRGKGAIILGLLQQGVIATADLFINASLEFFRHSYKGGPAPLRGVDISIKEIFADIEEERKERRKFSFLLNNLKRDGLVYMNEAGKWSISQKGKTELDKAKKNPEHRYLKRESKDIIVVSYDIPERQRANRNWLRSVLRLLDFKILHQSVWIGKTEIPETLLADLRERKIYSCIHIFTIGKEGSLTQIL